MNHTASLAASAVADQIEAFGDEAGAEAAMRREDLERLAVAGQDKALREVDREERMEGRELATLLGRLIVPQ